MVKLGEKLNYTPIGFIVDKSKATKTFIDSNYCAFPEDSMIFKRNRDFYLNRDIDLASKKVVKKRGLLDRLYCRIKDYLSK